MSLQLFCVLYANRRQLCKMVWMLSLHTCHFQLHTDIFEHVSLLLLITFQHMLVCSCSTLSNICHTHFHIIADLSHNSPCIVLTDILMQCDLQITTRLAAASQTLDPVPQLRCSHCTTGMYRDNKTAALEGKTSPTRDCCLCA